LAFVDDQDIVKDPPSVTVLGVLVTVTVGAGGEPAITVTVA
jgi:hypothetical protein